MVFSAPVFVQVQASVSACVTQRVIRQRSGSPPCQSALVFVSLVR